jgi:hypothetical protein
MATKPNPANFVVSQNSAVIVNPATDDSMMIRGLQGMGLCLGFTMETQTVAEMGRRIASVVPGGGAYEASEVNYNFIPGDASLEYFRNCSINSTKISAIRLYVKQGCDFSAPDLISDPGCGLYVGSMSDPRTDSPGGLYQGSLSYMPGGAFVLFVAHITGTTLSFTASTRTLADSGDGFVDAGFEVGDTCILDYAGALAPQYLKIQSVAAGAIVFEADEGDIGTLVAAGDFSGSATTALHGATPLIVTGYADAGEC